MALLFDATLGLFSGWIRALAGMAIASLAAVIVTAIELVIVEGQIAYLQAVRSYSPQMMDPQALTTIVIVFAVVMLVTTLAATRMTGAFRLQRSRSSRESRDERAPDVVRRPGYPAQQAAQEAIAGRSPTYSQTKVADVAGALAATVRREQISLIEGRSAHGSARPAHAQGVTTELAVAGAGGLGTIGRRSLGRRTRTAARRDRVQ
jgi:type IV secretion system protein VirB6